MSDSASIGKSVDVDVEVIDSRSAGAEIIVVSGDPDPAEMAAVTAVLSGVLEELAAEHGRREQASGSAWDRSTRVLRAPLHPGPGAWRSFSG